MFATSTARLLSRNGAVRCFAGRGFPQFNFQRLKSTSAQSDEFEDYDEDLTGSYNKSKGAPTEVVSFPSQPEGDNLVPSSKPVLLNASEHAVGYLGRVLNARVYDAAIETELQEAKNLSSVCILHSSEFTSSFHSLINCTAFAQHCFAEKRGYTTCLLIQD